MKSLIIVAHGSRLESSNEEVKILVSKMKKENYLIKYAFLELCKPNIAQTIEEVIKLGINEIEVFPYFLAAGKHVKNDIPNEINELKKIHKNIKIKVLPHLGNTQGLIDLILKNKI